MKVQSLIVIATVASVQVASAFGAQSGLRDHQERVLAASATCSQDVACNNEMVGMPCPAGMSGTGACVKLGCLVVTDESTGTVKVECGDSSDSCIPSQVCTMVWGSSCPTDIACNAKNGTTTCPQGMLGFDGACINPACVLTKSSDTVSAQCGQNTCIPNAECE